ncbi:MAG: acetate kinase [Hyphomicrobium sp. 32-62-53]|nr:MAG: acetate kinase [Hyphomicrobium sp. 12-62-95]OYX99184.1 MAG: acetate kinase [Hyphomicrobium sp. 32-62-53]
MSNTILVINAGSSSIKFQLFALSGGSGLERRLKGQIDGIGVNPHLIAKDSTGAILVDATWTGPDVPAAPEALARVVEFLKEYLGGKLPIAVGHRVVHGGIAFDAPTVVTPEIVAKLETFVSLAPLHQPNNLAPIKSILERLPHITQVACFDTAFHRGHPELADRYAIPEPLYREGVRRYGFHGLSYEYIASRLKSAAPHLANGKVVVAHLGSGASMCALGNGHSIDSSMGFTALDGLPMGTRPGQLDAGIVLYLLQQKGMTAPQIERFLYNDCGLKGLSGLSNDVRVLLGSDDRRARLAIDYFVHRIALMAGSLGAALEGIDGFVFTAGVGENAPAIRSAVVKRLAWLGAELDDQANLRGADVISSKHSRIEVRVIATDEELMIAKHTMECLAAAKMRTTEQQQ